MDFHQFYHLTWNYHTLILLDFNGRKVTFPYVPGFDISGTVAKLGEGVTSLAVGDEVRGGSLLVAIAGGIYIFLKSNGVFKRLWYLWKRKALHEWCIQYERDSQIQILKPNKSFGQVTQHCDSFEVAFEHSTIRIRQIGLRGSGPLWDLLQWLALRPRRWLCRVCRGAGWHGGQERWIVLQGPCWTSSCRHLEIRKWNKKYVASSGPNLTLPGMPFFGNQRGGSKPIEFGMMFCPSTAPSVQDSPAWLNRPGLTAYQAIFTGAGRDFTGAELGKLGAGQKLLVLGGAAATGTIAT